MTDNEYIDYVSAEIQKLCNPLNIILVSRKTNNSGETVGFKLIVIVEDSVPSRSELECSLYMNINCDIPYDVVLYRKSEWDKLKCDIGTFAWKIYNTGVYIYGQRV